MMRFVLAGMAIVALSISVAQARSSYVMATVLGDTAPTIEVANLDDPASPYCGKYSQLDRWAFDNFSYYVTNENYPTIQLSVPNIEQALKDRGVNVKIVTFKSYVELDATGKRAYLVPVLAGTAASPSAPPPETLGEVLLSPQSHQDADPRPYFWSLGLEDEAAMAEYRDAISAWLASVYPAIPDWMVAVGHDGDQYSFLPDGGVVIAVPEVKDDFSQRRSTLTRYDAGGKVLKQAPGDYMDWERLMLNDVKLGPGNPYFVTQEHRETSGRKAGTSNNIANTGRYQTYRNAARDGFLAVIDYWQGKVLTPADTDLTQLKTDPYPYFEMVDYGEIVRVHKAQQALAKAGTA